MFFNISRQISLPNECYSHFPCFQVSRHILGPTVCIYNFPCFTIFLVKFHNLRSVILILCDFQFSRHIPGPTVDISYFSCFSIFLVKFQYPTSVILIFVIFSYFGVFHVLQWTFLIFHNFSFHRHISCPKVCIFHFL